MKRTLLLFLLLLLMTAAYSQTLQECMRMAHDNYPLIRQYNLIRQTTEYTVSNIKKGWLPQVTANAQASLQSDVTAWPDGMRQMLSASGLDVKGLKKDQYRVGIDIVQTLYDGGAISAQRQVAELEGDAETAQADVNLYAVRQRVIEMYFSALMLQMQLKIQDNLIDCLEENERKLESMYQNGTAALSDLNTVKAELLSARQKALSMKMQMQSCESILALFCGVESVKPIMPDIKEPEGESQRPELRMFDSQINLAQARNKLLNANVMPKVSLFASGFYGYPGYNMFDDMMHHKWSLNGIVGMKVSWNIGALYTLKSDRAKLKRKEEMAQSSRETFLFNNRMDQIRQQDNMERYNRICEADDEIISLRTSVRIAAESRLNHGIIDVSQLVRNLADENNAKVMKAVHQIEFLKEKAELNYTINNF